MCLFLHKAGKIRRWNKILLIILIIKDHNYTDASNVRKMSLAIFGSSFKVQECCKSVLELWHPLFVWSLSVKIEVRHSTQLITTCTLLWAGQHQEKWPQQQFSLQIKLPALLSGILPPATASVTSLTGLRGGCRKARLGVGLGVRPPCPPKQ